MNFLVVSFLSLAVLSGSLFSPPPNPNAPDNPRLFFQLLPKNNPLLQDRDLQGRLKSYDKECLGERSMIGKQDPGVSVGNFSAPVMACLEDIAARTRRAGFEKVEVADLCAGRGHLAWKAAVFGASVVAVEREQSRLNALSELIGICAKQKLCSSRDVRLIKGDVLKFFQKEEFQEKFDFVWVGSALHFFSPSQRELFMKGLFGIIKPGGSVYCTVDTIHQGPAMEVFQSQKQDQILSLGYITLVTPLEAGTKGDISGALNAGVCVSTPQILLDRTRCLLVGGKNFVTLDGQEIELEEKVRNLIKNKNLFGKLLFIPMCVFSKETLSGCFQSAGFSVENCYYWDETSLSEDDDFVHSRRLVWLAIHAKKPALLGAAS